MSRCRRRRSLSTALLLELLLSRALLLALHRPALAPATNAPGLRYGRILRSCLSSAMDLKLESMLSAITAKKTLTARSSAGTGHLIRHIKSCKPRKLGSNAMSQSLLRFNPDGFVHHWEYNPEVARTQLCMLIAREDLPVCFGESAAFE